MINKRTDIIYDLQAELYSESALHAPERIIALIYSHYWNWLPQSNYTKSVVEIFTLKFKDLQHMPGLKVRT